MKINNIPLELLTPKKPAKIKFENGEFHIPAEEAMLGKTRHHVNIPGKYKLPFRIDMTVKTKFIRTNQVASQLTLNIGRGNVYFNGGHTSAVDVLTSGSILPSVIYHNDMQSGEFVDLSITFGSEMMWVTVNDRVCFAAKNPGYIDLLRDNATMNGLDIAICGGTDTKLTIKSLNIVEYENDEPDIPEENMNLPELSAFELFVKGLPPEIHDEVFRLDEFLLNDMKSILKFRRTIDKNNHLTYQSPYGFVCTIREYGVGNSLQTHWVQSEKKPDRTNDIINKLAESSPETAERIFGKLQICAPHSRECKQRTKVEYNSKSINVCMGKINYEMFPFVFEDIRKVVAATSEVVKSYGTGVILRK